MALPNPRVGVSLCAAALLASACATPASDTGPSDTAPTTLQMSARLYLGDADCIETGTVDVDARHWPPEEAVSLTRA